MGIQFQGRNIEEFKAEGSHRSSSINIDDLTPHFSRLGITRIGNITGLDRIGIPVTIATRPNSPTISINSGKGLTLDQARISGAMEAIEIAVAEESDPKSFRATYDELQGRIGTISIENLALTDGSVFHRELPFNWVPCFDLIGQTHVAVPAEMVGMRIKTCYSMLLAFQVGSNGLASGGSFLEAVSSGLSEVIERDAWTCRQFALQQCGIQYPRVKLETIKSSDVIGLIQKIKDAGMELFLYDVTCDDIPVPVYGAMIVDRLDPDSGVFLGYGCHLDPSTAMIRAITEAAQGRCCYIAGARDDLFRRQFMVSRKQQKALEELESHPATVEDNRPNLSTDSIHGDIEVMLDFLQSAGLNQVLVCDLSDPLIPVSIVRVIVPGLEGHLFEHYAPGQRAKSHANPEE